jgi:hypothetical protein
MSTMQLKRISHGATFLFKFVWPAGWLGFIGAFLLGSILGSPPRWGPRITPFWGNAILVLLFGFGIVFVIRLSIPLKHVDEGDGSLHISGFFSDEVVPLANIRAVKITGDFGHNRMPSVEVRFRQRTRYGSRIVFLAASKEGLAGFLAGLESGVEIN